MTTAAQQGGTQHLTIRLDPLELGHVQIRIERTPGSPARVVLAVERSDTLMLLMQDRPQLNQALDAAGVPSQGRSLEFSLSSGDSQGSGTGGQSAGQGFGSGQGSNGFSNRGGHQDAPPRPTRTPWLRAGVDITA